MKIASLAAAVLTGLLSAGCMPSAPKRADALSVLSSQSRARETKKLRLGLIFSENTRNAANYLQKASNSFSGRWALVDDVTFFQRINDALERQFASVVVVENREQAKAEGADLAAILDVYVKLGGASFTKYSADLGAAFQTLDGAPISTVRGGAMRRVSYPATNQTWGEASGAAINSFAVAVSTNTELAAFAARIAPAPAAAPLVAAPVAPTYSSDIETPSFRLPEDKTKFALVVGVERYASLPPAEHAARDAQTVRAHLLAAGYPERNIVLLLDQQAGKSGLEKYLDAWLPKNTDSESSILFYFSGHGAPNPEDEQAYLVPWDGDPKFLANTGYPVKRLYERLNALKARRILVAMDACFSGTGGRSVLAKGTRPLVAKVDLASGAAGRVQALTASGADEITGVDEPSAHGLFTYHLLKGLSAKKGNATFKALHDYLTPKVQDAARRENRDQTPQLIGTGDASF